MASWAIEELAGAAGELHALDVPQQISRTAVVLRFDRPSIVLGSTQPQVHGSLPAGVEVVRRRSGGGAVWLPLGGALWVDVLLPRHDPLWTDDISSSGIWLGETWAAALASIGESDATVHRGAMVRHELAASFCFAGLAAGEVTRGVEGPKLVGVSQRRTRAGARFQCIAYATWDAALLARAVDVSPDAVAGVGAGVGDGRLPALEAAFLAALGAV